MFTADGGVQQMLPRLKQVAYQYLCKLIVDDFLNGAHQICVRLRSDERLSFLKCVLMAELQDEPWLELPQGIQALAYLLRGLLSSEVLLLALSKRYRVEYGVHPAAARRYAVPYRAKDVAAERTEFGHPDVAILLTYLTYYRGGTGGGLCQGGVVQAGPEDSRPGSSHL